jgi:beta-glucosidase-like glycosyl hydrolase
VEALGAALAEEFSGKGANFILGPSINVHRVARNGRNFEYLSGEDPYLGEILTKAYVEGVQNGGIGCVAKHFVFNQQETNRQTESSVVDNRTAHELYVVFEREAREICDHFTLSCLNYIRRISLTSLTNTVRKSLEKINARRRTCL